MSALPPRRPPPTRIPGDGTPRPRPPSLWRDPIFVGGVAALLLFVGIAIGSVIGAVHTGIAERACLRRGFPSARVTWHGHGAPYCIKRVDQSDVVVPLESLEGAP